MSFKDTLSTLVDKLKSVDKERVYSAVKSSLRIITVLGATGVLAKDKKLVRVANEATEVLDKIEGVNSVATLGSVSKDNTIDFK